MPVAKSRKQTPGGVPLLLLWLALLAMLISLFGLLRTANIANERVNELQASWQLVQDGPVEGSELIATDILMQRVQVPVPALAEAAYWSLGLGIISALLVVWLVLSTRYPLKGSSGLENSLDSKEEAAVIKLMDEMAPLASGDLRVRATVSETATGSLADAFNYAISEMQWLVSSVGKSSEQVNNAIDRSRQSARHVADACAEQSRQIHRSSNELLSMSAAMSELAADAADSSVAAQATVEQVEKGSDALLATLKRLSSIHEEADVTTKLMYRLKENVAAIDERAGVIEEVARQTDLLALNTTIRASAGSRSASVGDAAADLGRLSDEVAQLADVLGQATKDIISLTRTISLDAADTVQSMEHTTSEIASGVQQTQAASDALDTIYLDAQTVRARVVDMTEKTVTQSGTVAKLTEYMDLINRITRQTSNRVTGNAESLDELQELAAELRQSVSDFRLPAQLSEDAEPAETSKARKAANRAAII